MGKRWAGGQVPTHERAGLRGFVTALAKRYGKGGTFWSAHRDLPQRPLAAIEIWNEPWLWTFWKPEPDPAQYAALVRAAAPAIKAARRDIKVLISGDLHLGYPDARDYTGGTHRNWEHGFLARLLKHDLALNSFDAYSVHPYSQKFGPFEAAISSFADQTFAQQWLYQKLVLIRDMLRAAGKFKPLWNTEFGWSTSGDVDEPTQAEYFEGALKRAVEEWGDFVERSFIFVLSRPNNTNYAGGLQPLPRRHDAWHAVRRLLAEKG